MGRFRDTKREVPELNMAAMPDLIFTVLFFFMIVTHMRDVKPQVHYTVPQGTAVEKARQSGVIYIFIGKPVDEQGRVLSDETRIQVNNRIVHVGQIGEEIDKARAVMAEDDRPRLVVSLQADRDTEMGIINSVKQALREAGALNINYSATNRNKKITNQNKKIQ